MRSSWLATVKHTEATGTTGPWLRVAITTWRLASFLTSTTWRKRRTRASRTSSTQRRTSSSLSSGATVSKSFGTVFFKLKKIESIQLTMCDHGKLSITGSAHYQWVLTNLCHFEKQFFFVGQFKTAVSGKLGRIRSNSFEFRIFEFWNSNSKVEFGRIRPYLSNSIEFDLKFDWIRTIRALL